MFLPEPVQRCIHALEQAGFSAYAVGGCVRDSLLSHTPHDYDLCTNATPDILCQVFSGYNLVRQGEKHGTIGVIIDSQVYEITTFRTEGGYQDARHPEWVRFVPSVEEDLARRDFTVNAMAYTPKRGYIDPFGGQRDLQDRILRAVGDPRTRFSEDALRILRGVRFAARFRLTPDPATLQAMEELAPTIGQLAVERVFSELCQLLLHVTAQDLCTFQKVLLHALPELAPTADFDQCSPHHTYDVFTHTAHVTGSVPDVLPLRWAALLHDVGKIPTFTRDETGRGHFYGHAPASARMADAVLRRLKAPTALREQAVQLIELHMTKLIPEKKNLRRWLGKLGWETIEQLLWLQEADMRSKGTGNPEELAQFAQIRGILEEIKEEKACCSLKDLAVNGNDLMALGFKGREIGKTLNLVLEQVIDEKLPNEREALLDFIERVGVIL